MRTYVCHTEHEVLLLKAVPCGFIQKVWMKIRYAFIAPNPLKNSISSCLLLMNPLFFQQNYKSMCFWFLICLFGVFVHLNAEGILPASHRHVLFVKMSNAFLTSYSLLKLLVNDIKTRSLLPQKFKENLQHLWLWRIRQL